MSIKMYPIKLRAVIKLQISTADIKNRMEPINSFVCNFISF